MTVKEFIQANRDELDEIIQRVNPGFKIDDHERTLWIFNDADIYTWAKSEGVDI